MSTNAWADAPLSAWLGSDPLETLTPAAHGDQEMPEQLFAVRTLCLDDDLLIIEIFGGLDVSTAPQLDWATDSIVADIPALPGMQVRLDLAGLTFCDTAGLDSLSRGIAVLEAAHGRVEVCGARRQVRRLLAFAADHCWLTASPLTAVANTPD